jgi:hypothetical protein
MVLLFRGTVWFGLFVAVALLPLAVGSLADPWPARKGVLDGIHRA